MALIVSAATGNFNAGATWVGGVVPTVGDEARASTGHTITITANATCDEVSNAGTGIFTLNDGVTLTANVTNKSTTASRNCVQFSANSPAIGYIIGNCTGGTVTSAQGAINSGTGTLNVTGNSVAGSGGASIGVNNSGTGTTNITGNVTAGSGSNAHGAYVTTGILNITGSVTGGSTSTPFGVRLEGAGTLNITGNVTASSVSGGVSHLSTNGFVNITGNVTAGAGASSIGVLNESTGLVTINGICTGGTTNGAAGVRNALTGTIRLTRAVGNAYGPGNTAGLVAAPGAANVGLGVIEIEQLEYGTFGQSPTTGTGIRFKKVGSNAAVFNFCDTAGAKTLIDSTQNAAMPAANNVRSGVSYASGALTGSCAVPAASSVAFGVPVDNTTGTALLTGAAVATAVWGAATRSITGGTVDTLTNPPTVPTVVQIRQEMDSNSTKLANLDATVSSRLAPSGTLAVVTTLTNAPASVTPAQIRAEMDANSTKLANLDTTISSRLATSAYTAPTAAPTAAQNATAVWGAATKEITGGTVTTLTNAPTVPTASEIAAAVEGSLLNEADGQAVLNAIVAAIGNQNLSEVSLVAAVRADLERTGGKLDSIPTTAAPTAAQNASAVWGASAKVITGGVVDTLTNAPSSVTPSDIWSHATRTLTSASGPTAVQIRQEMDSNSTKLANLDAAVSSRLAGSAYSAPATPPTAVQIRQEIDANSTKLDVAVSSRLAASESTKLDAVKAKTDALNSERLANVATTAIVGNLIAQANS